MAVHGGIEAEITRLLEALNARGGYGVSLVCTDDGLLIAAAGAEEASEQLAGITSLFDDIVVRWERDLGAVAVDELTVRDALVGRVIVRRLPVASYRRFFLVVQAPARASWRRNTSDAGKGVARALDAMLEVSS